MKKKLIIIGGGAAGFFVAINAAEMNPELEVLILEGSNNVLQKVKVSGGGRCNVTHACFTPNELVEFYPRGKKELRGPFHQFMTGDTMEWFENRGVSLKIEDDNRVFPESNSSQTIIDCFLESAKNAGVKVQKSTRVDSIEKNEEKFIIKTNSKEFIADYLLVASGSNAKVWSMLEGFGHTIVKSVPSLFTFNIEDKRLQDIPGSSVPKASVKVLNSKLREQGPLLITHWGLSGPGILKLSAWGALELYEKDYQFEIEVNWLSKKFETVLDFLKSEKKQNSKKQVILRSVFEEISKRLWEKFVIAANISANTQWAQLNNKQLEGLAKQLTQSVFNVNGKSTFKDEFVTAGGINLKEINFKRFESKLHKNLFFAGEVLNIDAVTGGFNFQNAWTGGWIVANAISDL
ncbi:MAG: aminoacetone oxidase family FAD-binding enzyme [Lutibacter sp.]|uniref:NAD(P)/FAD-dependent oxidoreductase n=1 Tax=Lutibacter sp. TaxID=1925666 RepID=UPI0019F5597D|nr:NAD(P)/FAD-dependent oxidoreductase [Lutibacter sp.]NOR27188.1 aminoacetone oxidase family FAD-binding enzyme [Lutibacter sp.]